jgi:hypothetical protein
MLNHFVKVDWDRRRVKEMGVFESVFENMT